MVKRIVKDSTSNSVVWPGGTNILVSEIDWIDLAKETELMVKDGEFYKFGAENHWNDTEFQVGSDSN